MFVSEAAEVVRSVAAALPNAAADFPEAALAEHGDDISVSQRAVEGMLDNSDADGIIGSNNPLFHRTAEEQHHFRHVSDARFEQLTIPARKEGAIIIRGDPTMAEHLKSKNATAVTLGDCIFFQKDACVSEILEETRHFYQNKIGMNNDKQEPLRTILNEIEAREYIFANAAKYQVPRNELVFMREQYENYLKQLWELEER